METQTLDIQEYVISEPKKNLTKEQREDAWKHLERLKKTGLPVEEFAEDNIKQALARSFYPEISPEFLSIGQEVKYDKWTNLGVPKFGVYTLTNPNMVFDIWHDPLVGDYRFKVSQPENVSRIILENLALATDIGIDKKAHRLCVDKENVIYRYSSWFASTPKEDRLPKKIVEKLKGKHYKFSSNFYGIIPEETKEKASEARRIFRDDIYVLAETNSEDWSVAEVLPKRVVVNPLLVGVAGEKCFLVDKFDTTPLEDYITREFSDSR